MHWYLLLSLGSTKLHRKLSCRLLPVSSYSSDFITCCNRDRAATLLGLGQPPQELHTVPGLHHPKPCTVPLVWAVLPSNPYKLKRPFPKEVPSSTAVSFDVCKDASNCRLYLPRYLKKGISKCACEAQLTGKQCGTQHKQTQSHQRFKGASALSPQVTFR